MARDNSTSRATSSPAIAAGTRPNGDSTEYLPPMLATP
jgi:hypothetical protein